MAAGWVLSAVWHLLVLLVLVQEIHPFDIPQETPTVQVQLLPPLAQLSPQPQPEPEKPLERIQPAPAPVEVPRLQVQKPQAPVAIKPLVTHPLTMQAPPEVAPPAPEALRTAHAVASQRIEIERQPALAPARPSLNQPLDMPAPPVVTPVPTPPAPALSVQPAAVPAPAPVAAPPQPAAIAAPSTVVSTHVAPLPVLTNDQTTSGPIEIKPPDHQQEQGRAGAPALPPSGGGAPPMAGGGGGSGGAGGGKGGASAYDGPVAGFDNKGLRTTLGCLNPETYHLTAAEREACLQRVARETRGGRDLGPNIPPDKMAEYERKTACHNAYAGQVAPSVADPSTGSPLNGLGNVVSLRDCGPGDR